MSTVVNHVQLEEMEVTETDDDKWSLCSIVWY